MGDQQNKNETYSGDWMRGISVCRRVVDILVAGAISQVELDIVWNGLVFFDFKVNWSAKIDTVRLGDFVWVVIKSVGFDWKVLTELEES